MPFDLQRARPLLQSCDLPTLFVEEIGWEPARQKLTLREAERDHVFTAVAQKHGFTVWLCESADGPNYTLPDHATRLKLDRKLSETSFEHLIVFATQDRAQQSWLWVRRETGRPLAARTHDYRRGQPGDSLLQKLQALFVSLEETEAGLSTVVVAGRARAAFDIERVTKAFYRDFDIHRKAFLAFIDGIGEVADQEWYASVMLNRLMFVYFIQRKGFLDGDTDYLRNRLATCKKEKGKDAFYSFYRYFLLKLFHEGFGKRQIDRSAGLEKLLGNIPYLNGGLFDVHELERPERYGKDIQIPDQAFERIFDYFDQYQWHLDERPLRKDDEINPDVLGYIFEKYINQKQMGAYYTKEDITEYISKSCIIPFLFDAARNKCKVAFDGSAGVPPAVFNQCGQDARAPSVWDLLRDNPDRYIYDAVKKGVHLPLPKEIAAGLDTTQPNLIERRKAWNKAAPAEYALPTETWREVIARRGRYEAIRNKLASGAVRDINDFITLNIDLRQFAQDVIQSCEGPDLLMAFWQATTHITILDPTGGSGAFIFAALNILEPLYEGCLDRMEGFLTEWGEAGKKHHPNYHKKFTEVLQRVDAHPNRRYFVLKSIILNNLYAVDIMEEAVEICKLRLFLKLASQVAPDHSKDNLGIEPLPDIDFNIRAGNTLVGYATYDEVKKAVTSGLDFDDAMKKISTAAADLQQTLDKFRQIQTDGDGSVPAADKQELQKRLKALEDELNRHLVGEYGVKMSDKVAYAKWLKSHQPFHWFVEFYGILNSGGFDVIIGNPPFVENTPSKVGYMLQRHNYTTIDCGNLYAFVSERSASLLTKFGSFSFIMPSASICTPRMSTLDAKFRERFEGIWTSVWDERPSKLFDGVDQQLAIHIGRNFGPVKHIAGSPMRHWASEEREQLFATLSYVALSPKQRVAEVLPKIGFSIESSILSKIFAIPHVASGTLMTGRALIFYRNAGGRYWRLVKSFPSYFRSDTGATATSTEKTFSTSKDHAPVLVALFSSSFFYWYWRVCSNCRHLTSRELESFPVAKSIFDKSASQELSALSERFEVRLKETKQRQTTENKRSGTVVQDIFRVSTAKSIIDEIDTVLARHYGFTPEELDFIINYDIKYRLGRGAGEEEE